MQRRILFVVFGTLMLDMIGTGMVIPIIPIIFTDPTSPQFLLAGYAAQSRFVIAGLVTALFGLMQFLAAPLLGELSDIYGRKRLLTVGVATLAFSQLLFGFGIEIASVPLILFARSIAGIAGANFSIAQAAIADVTQPQDRAKNFGLVGAAFGLGFMLGPLLGGWIASAAHSPSAPFWFAGALGIVNVLFITFMLPETRKERVATLARKFTLLKGIRNIRMAFNDVDARPVYLTSFFYMCGFAFFVSFIGILLVNRFGFNAAGVGTFFGVVGLCVVITQMFILRFLTRFYRERTILRVSFLCVGTALLLFPFMPSTLFVYLLIPCMAIPQGLSMANIQALVSKGVSADKQGAALGINSSLMAFANGTIPLIAGFGSGFVGIAAPFVAGSGFVYLAWLNLFVFSKK